MAVLIGVIVFLAVLFALAAVAQRRRRGNRPGQHGALDNGMAGRHATGTTVTQNLGNTMGPGGGVGPAN